MQEQPIITSAQVSKKGSVWPKIAGVGIIAALMTAGIYTAVSISPLFANTFNKLAAAVVSLTQTFIPGERITLDATPKSVNSGGKIVLSWAHRNKTGEGMYSLIYPCQSETYLGVKVSSGDKMLLCDTPSQITSADQNLELIAVSELVGVVVVPVTLSYTQSTGTQPALSATVALSVIGTGVVASDIQSPDATTTPPMIEKPLPVKTQTPTAGEKTEKTYPLQPTTVAPAPVKPAYGKADLMPRITSVGIIDKTTNVFTSTTTLRVSDRIAVKFEVENLGTADSGGWYFSAVLPTYPMHIFQSEGQQNLAPGDRIEFTIGFDQVEPDKDGRFVINVDPSGSLPEATKANNIATTTIRASI